MNQRQSTIKDHEQNGKPGGYLCTAQKREDVPLTAGELGQWLRTVPAGPLHEVGHRAWLALMAMEAGPAHQCEATDTLNRRDLLAFIRVLRAKDSLNLCL
jgi:hypothetical protein